MDAVKLVELAEAHGDCRGAQDLRGREAMGTRFEFFGEFRGNCFGDKTSVHFMNRRVKYFSLIYENTTVTLPCRFL